MSATETRAPICPRSGIRTFRRQRRTPEPTRLGLALGIVLVLLLAGAGLAIARADDEPEATPIAERYQPASRGTRAAVTRWRPMLAEYAWDVDTALRIVDCESGGDPEAINPSSGAAGLFQLYGWAGLARRLFGDGRVLIPWVNVATAFALWEDSGGRFGFHWAASAGCWR